MQYRRNRLDYALHGVGKLLMPGGAGGIVKSELPLAWWFIESSRVALEKLSRLASFIGSEVGFLVGIRGFPSAD